MSTSTLAVCLALLWTRPNSATPPAAELEEHGLALARRALGRSVAEDAVGPAVHLSKEQARSEAYSALRAAVHLEPRRDAAWFALATLAKADGDTEEAKRSYRNAVAANSSHGRAQLALARLLLKEQTIGSKEVGDLLLASAQLLTQTSSAQLLAADHLAALTGAEAQQRSEEAELFYRKASELDPTHAGAQFGLGLLLGRRQRHAEAADAFQHVLRLAPGRADAHLNLGVSFVSQGKRFLGPAAQSFAAATSRK
eukprot:TRINITY_DN49787_c0_g1_i1.p1 TRINITY_DN49787_c0_g1~~TRINITY_DN49787_c0_g1_i1.p1  ORF type:complete len:255 (-),score=65.93 TRINITY_DN49787_c0_g1_i1:64-828(-)